MIHLLKNNIYILLFLQLALAFSQNVLFDDVNNCHPRERWSTLLETLSSNGATVHYVSEEGWSNLMSMNMLWIECPYENYSEERKLEIISFCRNSGKIVIGQAAESVEPINDLLLDSNWRSTMEIHFSQTEVIVVDYAVCFRRLSPLTDSIDYLELWFPAYISCGDNAYPFAFASPSCNKIAAAISYPFRDENNCNSFVLLVSGTHSWETDVVNTADNLRFATNILLCAADIPGFEIEPCAIPSKTNDFHSCDRYPNPFTPNGDGINDYVQFGINGLRLWKGKITIMDMYGNRIKQIDVQVESCSENRARWDGTDSSGAPVPQGLYLYVIESDGEVICNGTITVAR